MRYVLWGMGGLLLVVALVIGGGLVWLQNADLAPLAVRMIKSRTGLDVEARGPLTLKLLPHPELHAQKVTVPSPHGGPALFQVAEADMKLKWGSFPLIWRGVSLDEMRLVNPVVNLSKAADGTTNWQVSTSPQQPSAPKPPHTEEPSHMPVMAFGHVDVRNLQLTYSDATNGRKIDVQNMNVQADARNGQSANLLVDGTVNKSPVRGNATMNIADLRRVPLTANMDAAGIHMALDGEVREQQTYAGSVNMQASNLRASLQTLLGKAPPQVPDSPFTLTGDVVTGGQQLGLKNFNASLGTLLHANGDINVQGGNTPSANGTFSAEGSNLKTLVALVAGDAQAAQLPAAPFKLHTTLSGQNEINLQTLNAELTGLAVLDGNLKITPQQGANPQLEGQLQLRGGNLKALASAFGSTGSFPSQPFSAEAHITGKDPYTLNDLQVQLANLATISGNLTVSPQPLSVNGRIELKGNDLATAAGAFGSKGNLPRSPFSAGVTIAGKDRMELSDLAITLPQLVEATGNLSLAPQAPHDMRGSLTFARLNLDALGYCARSSTPTPAVPAAGNAPAASSASPWSDTPLPLEGLRNVTADVTVQVDTLTCTSFPAQTLGAHVRNTVDSLSFSDVKAQFPQNGSLTADISLGHGASTPKLAVKLQTEKLPVQSLVHTLADKGMILPLDGKVTLGSTGSSTRQLAQNLNGSINFTANSGRVPYVQMLGNVSSISQLLQGKIPQQQDDSLQSLTARYTVHNGIASTDELAIRTGGLNLTGNGTINLPQWTIDYTLTPQVDVGSQVSVPVLIQGSLGSPAIGPDKQFISKLSGRLVGEGIKGLLGVSKTDAKGYGGAVGDIISGQGLKGENVQKMLNNLTKPKNGAAQDLSGTQPEPAQQKINPLDMLKGVLQGQ